MKLNLGCAHYYKEGYINVDIDKSMKHDVTHDLNKFPYPFKDNSVDLIECNHIMEHLDEPFDVMRELHRILKPSGKLIIRVPHCSRGFTHAQHKRGFDVSFPYYFRKDFVQGYQGVEFILEHQKLTWFAQPHFKKDFFPKYIYYPLRIIGSVLNMLASLSPGLCSRVWCYWVGGFEEISFVFSKPEKEVQGYICCRCGEVADYKSVRGTMREPFCKRCDNA